LNAALFGFLIVLMLVALPETKYNRADDIPAAPVFDPTVVKDAGKAEQYEDQVIEKHVDDQLGRGRPSGWQYNPLQPYTGSKASLLVNFLAFLCFQIFDSISASFSSLRDLVTPWTLMLFPIVQWTSFAVSYVLGPELHADKWLTSFNVAVELRFSSSCFLILNLTQSFVFAAPPYNFSAAAVGYTNLAVFGGALLGLVTAGPLGDWVSQRATKKNRLVREPEMRLLALWPFMLILAAGSIVVAVGYEKQLDWKITVIIGYGLIGWQVASIPPIAITYAIDSYKPVSGDLLVAVTVNKNLWGYGVSQFLIPWILKKGYYEPILINTGLTLLFTLIGVVGLGYAGKRVRGWTKNSYVHNI
ncbi:hypothetical protein P7C70_g5200, partial [Phenoliferia sp. Uapishka_3]